MRTLLALAIAVGVPAAASALPPAPLETGRAATLVQNRFLPGFLGGGDRKQQEPNGAARIEQLEAQVRMLTGQVEQLTFSVRRLEQMMQQQGVPQQQGALAGPGAPPRPLGTLPAPSGATASNGSATPGGTPPAGADAGGLPGVGGPIDLSVLNNGAPGGATAGNDGTVTASAPSAPPTSNSALANVRQLQSSGRYAMAADEARAVLAANPDGEVAGEARYILGEVLLAQGDYRAAANQFLENYTSDPNNSRAPQSLLQLGRALNQLGEREAACSSLDELFGAYPGVDGELRAAAERERKAANCA